MKAQRQETQSQTALDLDDVLAFVDAADGGESGMQPIGQAWLEVFEDMKLAFTYRDYERALELGERYLKHDPQNEVAQLSVHECRAILEAQLEELLGPLDRKPTLAVPLSALANARLDHRASFLLTRIDGHTSIEDLLDLAGMPRLDAMLLLRDFVEQGYIAIG